MPPLSGHLSGTLGPGDFQVTAHITVDSGQTLTILPDTRLFFAAGKRFVVHGELLTLGTEQDSILFTHRHASDDSLWAGIKFERADSTSRMEYCVVEYGRSYQQYGGDAGGISVFECSPTFVRCSIRYNIGIEGNYYSGGGMCLVASNSLVDRCLVTSNTLSGSIRGGGGIYCGNGSPTVLNSIISHNVSSPWRGGGVYCDYTATALFEDCVIESDSSQAGGGIWAGNQSRFVRCRIEANYGGGVRCSGGIFTRCTIAGNNAYNGSAALINGPGIFTSCIFASEGDNSVLYFLNGSNSHIEYCDVYSSDGVPFGYYEDDSSRAPLIFGTIIVTNANGDSCDTYYNIFMDPQFADTANGDFHLLAGSPCIDAGDPELLNDPDGTVADIGAFYFNQLDAEANFILHPSSFILSAYPNPFNSAIRISFDLPRNEFIELSVYDIGGRRIATLLAEPMTPGRHAVNFDASALPSGIYFSRLQGGGFSQTKKIVLIK